MKAGHLKCDSIKTVNSIKTLKLRIKDKHSKVLGQMAREVNQVFNYCNETSSRAIRERHHWLSGYDLQKLTAGFSKCEGVTVGSGTTQLVCAEYATRRKQFKKTRLNWRVSNPQSPKRSLGWVPFKDGLSQFELRAGSFSQDARGRWYRANEQALAIAQRARKKGRVKAIHAKIRNQRKDALHKFSTTLVQQNAARNIAARGHARLAAGIPAL